MKDMSYLRDIVIPFKSIDPYYLKEKSGIKPNTVREINLSEDKFQDLLMMYNFGIFGFIKITKDSRSAKFPSFERRIEDISIWNNLAIISFERS